MGGNSRTERKRRRWFPITKPGDGVGKRKRGTGGSEGNARKPKRTRRRKSIRRKRFGGKVLTVGAHTGSAEKAQEKDKV